ncbi:MAG: hypothetical protein MJ229_01355 [bacterium]|nr:hypothetical protein [bacterium]
MTFTSAYADEFSVAENTYKEDLEFDIESTKKVNNRTQIKETVYIKNIEIEGTNVIKPEDVMSVMQMQRGDEFSRDLIQADLKSIYNLGSFTEHMKAIPITNADGSITLKIVLEENTPIVDYTLDGNSAVSTDELMTFLA